MASTDEVYVTIKILNIFVPVPRLYKNLVIARIFKVIYVKKCKLNVIIVENLIYNFIKITKNEMYFIIPI